MENGKNLEGPFPTKENIEKEIVSLIAKVNILYLIADGLTKEDNRVGLALEEISQQLDQQSRQLGRYLENAVGGIIAGDIKPIKGGQKNQQQGRCQNCRRSRSQGLAASVQ